MSERRIWTLHRVLCGTNGAIIDIPLKHFTSQKAAEEAKQQGDDAFKLFFSGVLVVQGKPVMEALGLMAQMCLQGIGHTISEGDVHEASIISPVGSSGPTPKLFIPGLQ